SMEGSNERRRAYRVVVAAHTVFARNGTSQSTQSTDSVRRDTTPPDDRLRSAASPLILDASSAQPCTWFSAARNRRGVRSWDRYDPRAADSRDRDDSWDRSRGSRGGSSDRDRDDDPRDVFTRDLDLPRGHRRELVREHDHVYEINGAE